MLHALPALLHLASPQLPVGGFSYSQGLEAAIECGWVKDAGSAEAWIGEHFDAGMACWELPTLALMHRAALAADTRALRALNEDFIASRDTAELRAETQQMGWSLIALLAGWTRATPVLQALAPAFGGLNGPRPVHPVSFPCAFAIAGAALDAPTDGLLSAYAFAWVENQVAAAIKAVPLGQAAGQGILLGAHERIAAAVAQALQMPAEDRHTTTPQVSILSARHETQYSRLFRS